ncbi:hypothetical protein HMPREF0454_03829 [Hafnia alvei ATCC 51873]|uniref:Uncharacterized protein n=1 Tax=Hafnia alvei ATCC 51873 TaxID=1002364 RepID=G9YB50_HAFAL|nr:hypothetical protein HMPREF0454_03829 [Hafnia alvei ATCC 51873]
MIFSPQHRTGDFMNKKKEVRRLVAEAFQNLRENKTVTPSNIPWCI